MPIKLTNAAARAAILRYAASRAIATEGRTEQQVAEAVLRSLLRYVRDVSIDRQRAELLAVGSATMEATIAADNDMVDPEPVVP